MVITNTPIKRLIRSGIKLFLSSALMILLLIISIRLGYDIHEKSNLVTLTAGLLCLFAGSALYQIIFQCKVYRLTMLEPKGTSDVIRFRLAISVYGILDDSILEATLPEGIVLNERQMKLLLTHQLTIAELRKIVDYILAAQTPAYKEFSFEGKRFLVCFPPPIEYQNTEI